jgi:type IX secretion system PorP/SprF family membrane protein
MTITFMIRTFRNKLTVVALLVFTQVAVAQNAQFSQFFLNQLYFNPATAGADNATRFQLIHRTQYAGYQATNSDPGGAPMTQVFSASMPIKNLGVGFYAVNDKLGALTSQDFQVSVAYHLPIAQGKLAIGGRAGMYRKALDYNILRERDPNDPLIPDQGVASEIHPDVSMGLYYESELFYAGLSANHLLKQNYKLDTDLGTNPLEPTYNFNFGVHLGVGYLFDIQPIALVKSTISSTSVEGGAIITYNQRFWAGATYRHEDVNAIVMAGISLLENKSLRLSGAFDLVKGGDRIKSPASYEVLLSYDLAPFKSGKKTIVRTPRFRF